MGLLSDDDKKKRDPYAYFIRTTDDSTHWPMGPMDPLLTKNQLLRPEWLQLEKWTLKIKSPKEKFIPQLQLQTLNEIPLQKHAHRPHTRHDVTVQFVTRTSLLFFVAVEGCKTTNHMLRSLGLGLFDFNPLERLLHRICRASIAKTAVAENSTTVLVCAVKYTECISKRESCAFLYSIVILASACILLA